MQDQAITVQSGRSVRAQVTRRRIRIVSFVLAACFGIIAMRLIQLGFVERLSSIEGRTSARSKLLARP